MRDSKGRFIKGNQVNLGKKNALGYRHTLRSKLKMSLARKNKPMPNLTGKKNPAWKGEDASYFAKHAWVIRKKGKAKQCQNCSKISNHIDWANIDHKYKRNLNDYIPLCRPCHRKYDLKFIK